MKPILCRRGGKNRLVKALLKEIPKHQVYVEPFVGTGALFFAKEMAKKNVLGDNDRELVRFYKQAQQKSELTCNLKSNRNKWEGSKKARDKSPCNYIHFIKNSYACDGEYFTKDKFNGKQHFDPQIEKLKKTNISHSDFQTLIKKNDSKDTFFYLDPPYHKQSCHYPKGSCDVTPKDILDVVKNVKGKFLLSYNDHPEVRKTFCQKYKCKTVKTKYSINTRAGTTQSKRKELLIKNY